MLIDNLLAEFNNNQPFTAQEKLKIVLDAEGLFSMPVRNSIEFINLKPSKDQSFTLGWALEGIVSAERMFPLDGTPILVRSRGNYAGGFKMTANQLVLALLLTKSGADPVTLAEEGSFRSLVKSFMLRKFSMLLTAHRDGINRETSPQAPIAAKLIDRMLTEYPEESTQHLLDAFGSEATPLIASAKSTKVIESTPGATLVIFVGAASKPKSLGSETFEAELFARRFARLNKSPHEDMLVFAHEDMLEKEFILGKYGTFSFGPSENSDRATTMDLFVKTYKSLTEALMEDLEQWDDQGEDGVPGEAFEGAARTCAALA